jgi:hypothetical protein
VIDAYVGARVPRRLITREAMTDAARVAPLMLINVVDDRSAREIRTVAATAAAAYRFVFALGGRAGNTVVVGSASRLDLGRIGARAVADPSPARLTRPAAMSTLVGTTVPLVDAELDDP